MPRDKLIALRLSGSGLATVDDYAEKETAGNRSEMIRKLLAEAVRARQAKTPQQRLAWGEGRLWQGRD